MHMIRKTFRLMVRIGLLAGLGLALFKFFQGRRSADEGRPSTDWAPAPAPVVNPNLPKSPPDPPLVQPAMLEELIEKKKTVVDPPEPTGATEPAPAVGAGESAPAATAGEPVVKEAPRAKKAAKKAPAAKKSAEPAAGPVKKVAPPKAAAKKAAAPADAPAKKAPAAKKSPAKKAAPPTKAAKKQQPE